MGKYIDATSADFDSLTKEGVCLVDFWAPWCGPCRMLGPVIEELAEEFDGKAKVLKVNTDDEQELAQKFGIRSIPTVVLMKDGKESETMMGVQSKDDLTSKLQALLG